jgi:hypothetical protein
MICRVEGLVIVPVRSTILRFFWRAAWSEAVT